jgi:hypothetical protein
MKVDRSKNGHIIVVLETLARPENSRSGYAVDGFEVHVHPDLVERLHELARYSPAAHFKYIFGTPVLCTSTGVVFAMARGTSSLILYLPGNLWGQPDEEFGVPWRQGFAWITGRPQTAEDEKHFAELIATAYSSANALSERSDR